MGRTGAVTPETTDVIDRTLQPGPHRCWEITLKVGADEWETLVHHLVDAALHVQEHGPECEAVQGGGSGNYSVRIEHRPEMTHERYFAELDVHLGRRRGHEEAD